MAHEQTVCAACGDVIKKDDQVLAGCLPLTHLICGSIRRADCEARIENYMNANGCTAQEAAAVLFPDCALTELP